MNKWVTFGLVAVASLALAAASSADVPSELTSTVTCYCTASAGGGASTTLPHNCTICPLGDGPSEDIHVDVVVNNILGQPLTGSNVTVTTAPLGGASECWCPGENPQVGVSVVGVVNFVFDNGSVSPVEPTPLPLTPAANPSLDFDVVAVGPGPGGPVALEDCDPQLVVLAFEAQTQNCTVGLDDFARFASDFATDDVNSDFDHDRAADPANEVDLADFAKFAAHFGHTCP